MKKRQKTLRKWLLRVGAGALALFLLLPINWGEVSRRAALVAVGLRQPIQAMQVAEHQFTAQQGEIVTPPTTQMAPWDYTPPVDTTVPDIPTAAAPLTAPPITMMSPPGEKGDGGKVIEKKMSTGDRSKNGIAIINRSGTAVDIAAALAREWNVTLTTTDAPQVLILHTHGSEGYMTYDAGYYNSGDRNRTEDHTKNVCAVGEAIRLVLAQHGITAVHDTTVHDRPVYSGAYTRSAEAAKKWLEQYPTIQVVLDIHRDAIMEGDTNIVKPTAVVDGKKAAQMMLITGVVSTEGLPHPYWQENLAFSTRLQQAMDRVSPDLMRPLNTVASRYNQHLSAGWVLVEVGSEGNTVEEAVYAGQLLAQTLVMLLN